MTIYERIRALRIEKGLSQGELARLVGYEGRSAISKVENGDRDISQSMIEKYANALGVSPAYLLYGDNEGEDSTEKEKQLREQTYTNLFSRLNPAHQEMIIAQIKGILATYDSEGQL